MNKRKIIKWSIALIGGGIGIGILLTVIYFGSFMIYGEHLRHKDKQAPIQFSSVQWCKAPLYGSDNTRYKMYKDLIARYTLKGMTKEEIIELLGPQSDPAYFKDWDLRYWLGPEPGWKIDSIWLVIKLKNNRVDKYQLITD
jgi:hypothetical protein